MDMWLASRHSHGSVALNSQGRQRPRGGPQGRRLAQAHANVPLPAPRNNTAEFPYGRLAQPVLGQVADQDLLLDIGRQLQQIHDLTNARTRDWPS